MKFCFQLRDEVIAQSIIGHRQSRALHGFAGAGTFFAGAFLTGAFFTTLRVALVAGAFAFAIAFAGVFVEVFAGVFVDVCTGGALGSFVVVVGISVAGGSSVVFTEVTGLSMGGLSATGVWTAGASTTGLSTG